MRSKVSRTLALALLLCGVGMTAAQQPGGQGGSKPGGWPSMPGSPPKQKQKAAAAKSRLEEMLAEALKNNPDIRVAAAKLAEADAELNRSRLQVMQKVVSLHAALASQKAEVAYQQAQYERYKGLAADRAIGPDLLGEAEKKLTIAKAKLEELEAQLPALLGKSARVELDARVHDSLAVRLMAEQALYRLDVSESVVPIEKLITFVEPDKRHKATGPMSERLRKALQTPVSVDCKSMTLDAILDQLAHTVAGASFRVVSVTNRDKKINLRFKEALPLSAVLQALSDEFGCCFYIREYGILATHPNEAPPGALTVEEFLRQRPAEESRRQSSGGKNAPESVEGVIKAVDKDGLLTISIGSDAGLAKGQTLKLYVMPHQPPVNDAHPLGTVRVMEVEAHQAVVQPVGRMGRSPQAGDRIIGQIQKK